jgi:hypothetical protein
VRVRTCVESAHGFAHMWRARTGSHMCGERARVHSVTCGERTRVNTNPVFTSCFERCVCVECVCVLKYSCVYVEVFPSRAVTSHSLTHRRADRSWLKDPATQLYEQ